jgi:cytolysin-activating lysine-acyltransferase
MAGNARLAPNDWKSGDILWLVDIVAPFGGQEQMIKDLKEKVFAGVALNMLAVAEGKLNIKALGTVFEIRE